MKSNDRVLILECLNGRTTAFGELVRQYQNRLFNSIYRIVDNAEDAADVVQDAFLNAYQSLYSFKGDSEFFTWLYRIAFNLAITLKRKKKAILSFEWAGDDKSGLDPKDESEFSQPGDLLERQEEDANLQAALQKLSPEHRSVIVLKDIEGQKYEEIAEILDVPIGTIRSRLHRARVELKEILSSTE